MKTKEKWAREYADGCDNEAGSFLSCDLKRIREKAYIAGFDARDAEIKKVKNAGCDATCLNYSDEDTVANVESLKTLLGTHRRYEKALRDDVKNLLAKLATAEKIMGIMEDALRECSDIGNAYRNDWSDFDGRTLRRQIDAEVDPALNALLEYREESK